MLRKEQNVRPHVPSRRERRGRSSRSFEPISRKQNGENMNYQNALNNTYSGIDSYNSNSTTDYHPTTTEDFTKEQSYRNDRIKKDKSKSTQAQKRSTVTRGVTFKLSGSNEESDSFNNDSGCKGNKPRRRRKKQSQFRPVKTINKDRVDDEPGYRKYKTKFENNESRCLHDEDNIYYYNPKDGSDKSLSNSFTSDKNSDFVERYHDDKRVKENKSQSSNDFMYIEDEKKKKTYTDQRYRNKTALSTESTWEQGLDECFKLNLLTKTSTYELSANENSKYSPPQQADSRTMKYYTTKNDYGCISKDLKCQTSVTVDSSFEQASRDVHQNYQLLPTKDIYSLHSNKSGKDEEPPLIKSDPVLDSRSIYSSHSNRSYEDEESPLMRSDPVLDSRSVYSLHSAKNGKDEKSLVTKSDPVLDSRDNLESMPYAAEEYLCRSRQIDSTSLTNQSIGLDSRDNLESMPHAIEEYSYRSRQIDSASLTKQSTGRYQFRRSFEDEESLATEEPAPRHISDLNPQKSVENYSFDTTNSYKIKSRKYFDDDASFATESTKGYRSRGSIQDAQSFVTESTKGYRSRGSSIQDAQSIVTETTFGCHSRKSYNTNLSLATEFCEELPWEKILNKRKYGHIVNCQSDWDFPKKRDIKEDNALSSILKGTDKKSDTNATDEKSYEYEYDSGNHQEVVYDRFSKNPMKVLKIHEYDFIPMVKQSTDVVIIVEASTVSTTDCKIRSGTRNNYIHVPLPNTPGIDCVGRVIDCGEKANEYNIRPGDRVASLLYFGGNARYICTSVLNLAKIPNDVDASEAVCLVSTYVPAFQSLYYGMGKVARYTDEPFLRKKVLVIEGSTLVGQAIIELAVNAGAAKVFASGDYDHEDLISATGATFLGPSPDVWLDKVKGKIDVVIDNTFFTEYKISKRALKKRGKLIIADLEFTKEVEHSDFILNHLKKIYLLCTPQTEFFDINESWKYQRDLFKFDLEYLMELLSARKIQPKIVGRVALRKIPFIHKILQEKDLNGHVVCEPWMK